jgi:hypothetical protein
MGMGERKDRAKGFKQTTAKVVAEEVKEPGLFSGKAVESELTIECLCEPEDAPVQVGARARLVDMRERIDVFIGVLSVGYVATGQVAELRAKLKLGQRSGRSLNCRVIEVSEITPTFVVIVGT